MMELELSCEVQKLENVLNEMNCLSKLKTVDLKRENEILNIISYCELRR